MVYKYTITFEEIPGLPPRREVEFQNDLVHGAVPIANVTYQLVPKVLEDMKTSLENLLSNG